jgi:DNA-directed RNA polymerase subunit beta'
MVVLGREGELELVDDKGRVRARYNVPYSAILKVQNNHKVEKDSGLFEWDPYTNTILSEHSGQVHFADIIENESFREELDVTTGLRQRVIIEQKEKQLRPHIQVRDSKGRRLGNYSIPTGAHLLVHDGDKVEAGDFLVKIPRGISKTRDITGGLPRVAELFEARKPKDPAVVSEIDGVVEFGKVIRGATQILVKGYGGEVREYLIPHGKHLRVHDNDSVKAGQRLCEGPIDPHDILRIKGVNAVQEYLENEIQEVYRLQGVKINDKHIEVIVRQMLQKVKVEDIGDTNFLEGEQVDKHKFREENEKVIAEGGEPATFQPLLLGITKASLSTESFISAASFQETTRVLTEAAINGKTDSLLGLKENVIIGQLIPAGTGLERYRSIRIKERQQEKEEVEVLEETP